jgi:uracil-DNA glycosylase family 4
MTEEVWLTADELARQVRQHLESLRAAGVDWLPARAELPVLSASPAPAEDGQALQASLFEPAADTSAVPASIQQRAHELTVLREQVAQCERCPQLASTRTQTVFGVGPLDPELCFVGEAPGADEDAQGEPFVGAAGQLLNRIIAACGLKREEIFITNTLRCRPPGNRTPTALEASNCREWLERTLDLVRPRYICALGGSAAQSLLQTTQSLGRLRARVHDYKGIPVVCTYHPAFLLPHRQPEKKKDVWEDMKKLLARMGRPIPGK